MKTKDRIYLNDDWNFYTEFDESLVQKQSKSRLAKNVQIVRIPHSVVQTPYNSFSENIYQMESLYRKEFITQADWQGKKILLTVEAAAHEAEVFLNGKSLFVHKCGYTAFTVDLTNELAASGKTNVLAIKVNSKEDLDFPPFGYVIDYMTYGGIYRDVYLEIKNPIYIEDVFVKTKSNHFETEITLNTQENLEGYTIYQEVVNAAGVNVEPSAKIKTGISGQKILTSADAQPVVAWTLENPTLYNLVTELKNPNGKTVDKKIVRFGFREIRFDESGFYLNNKKIKLRGLNRHQSFPYVGYAMPKTMQFDDADILKFELGLNFVRTSHYPQSQYFIDRCDELGLLVFTEIPGWQNVGGDAWQKVHLQNIREMILQYRNHPSIFMWGVRVNESQDFDELYTASNEIAHSLDPSRPTGGVRFLKNSHLLEDVYTYNDFVFSGKNSPTSKKEDVTKTHKGYLISEYNGHMFPTKNFDDEAHRTEHAIRHAAVLDSVAADDKIAGASGWCAFDYNTHKDFGSGDRICYHGVMDMFRNPKLASYVYQSQLENDIVGDVLQVSSSMDIGEYPASSLNDVWIFTNADLVKLYVNGIFIRDYTKEDSPFPHLKHGPIYLSDTIGNRLVDEDKIPAKYSEDIKLILRSVRRYGQDNLPKNIKMKVVKLILLKVVDIKKLTSLYFKYIASWGGSRPVFKFEAYKNSKLVKTLVKTPGNEFHLEAKCLRTTLFEAETYDVAEVRLTYLDENSNVQVYCQEAISLSTEGPLEIIGPSAVSLKGGFAGVYVKTCGKAGKASLVIKDWTGEETKVLFVVKKSN